jgi:hypothetical protein
MKILFTDNISEIYVHKKREVWDIGLYIGNGKILVGYRYGLFPKYEKCYGVFKNWEDEYWGTIEEYNEKSTDKFIENETFYYKPYCLIVSNSGEQNKVIFETVEELLSYVDQLKDIGRHIILK